ncbi:MAG: hypothetical protein PHC71_05900 [Candidatus Omnitrophica bacterium]|nr:hypothetical protein [Candidatus Omnitrophota bacterium]
MDIASTLLWILGVLNFLGGAALGIPQIAQGKSVVFPFYILVLGIAACVTGYFLRKKQRSAAIAAIIVSVLLFISPPFIGLILGIIIIILIVTRWKELIP